MRKISSARPEVAPYPFTTKTIIVGKVRYGNYLFYVVDTPGIMEKPSTTYSEIEKRAIIALSALPDLILYLFDLSINTTQEVEYQLNLLRDIIKKFVNNRSTKIIVVANKIDKVNLIQYRKLSTRLYSLMIEEHNKFCIDEIIPISALRGHNISILLSLVVKCLYRY